MSRVSYRLSVTFHYYLGTIVMSVIVASVQRGGFPRGIEAWTQQVFAAWFIGLIAMRLIFCRSRLFRPLRLVIRDEGIIIPDFGHGIGERWDGPDDDRISKVVLYWYQIEVVTLRRGIRELLDVEFRDGSTGHSRKSTAYLTGADTEADLVRANILARSPGVRFDWPG